MRTILHTPFCALLLATWIAAPLSGQVAQPLFDSDERLVIRIEGPLGALLDQRDDAVPEDLEGATLTLLGEEGGDQVFDIKIMARGNFRRRSKNCDFPPFWVNLKKGQVKGTIFENQDRLKVVSHCVDKNSFYTRYTQREYLVYKTYNLLTDASFRVRLLQVEYVFNDRRRSSQVRPAFFIEHQSNLAKRIGGERIKTQVIPPELFDPVALNRAEFFQMLVGNTDFSYVVGPDDCCHNSRVFSIKDGGNGFVPVPYDFDHSGVVNAPYATPNPSLKINSVRERRYRGIQTEQRVFDDTIQFYRDHQDEIISLWENTELLSGSAKRQSVDYLSEFFALLDDPDKVRSEIIRFVRTKNQMHTILEKQYPDSYSEWPSTRGEMAP